MNDDLILLASAYLDGDVDDAERARVEGDPELLAEVERLRAVRVMLGDTEPSSISTREQLLANALDAWDRLPLGERNRDATPRVLDRTIDPRAAAAAATITAPTSLGDRRKATLNRRLLGAAAAIVLVLGAGIAAQVFTGNNDDDSGTVADVAASDGLDARDLADDSGADAAAELAPEAGPAADATESTQLDTGINDAAPPGEIELEQLTTPEELAIFASDAVGAPVAPTGPAATSAPIDDLADTDEAVSVDGELPLCLGADYVVGPALYRDLPVVVAVDENRELALAYLAESCREIARARLP